MAKILDPVTYYRASRWLYVHRVPLLPRMIKVLQELLFHCEIPFTAKIGPGFEVHHRGFGIVVHPRAEIGRNVTLSPCVTIGGRNGAHDVPKIGDGVFVASGAKILGDIAIGHGAVIGANAVVIRSVGERCVAAGVPARIIRRDIGATDRAALTGKLPRQKESALRGSARDSAGPVRVVSFIHSLELGGSETQCVEVAARMAGSGYDVTLACLNPNGALRERVKELGLRLVAFPAPRLLRPSAIAQALRFISFLRRNRIRVVHTNDLYSNLFAVPAAWLAGVPVIISSQRDMSHWSWYTPFRRKLLRKIQGMSSWLVTNSRAIRDDLVMRDGFAAQRILVIHNGIDTSTFAPGVRGNSELSANFAPGDRLIVMVANMHIRVKGHEDLIEAAQTVCHAHPEARFLLVGDGELRQEFERRVQDLGLEGSVLFLGHQTDVAGLLSRCDIGVLASRAEGLPNAVLEYMASGLATVATAVGGVPEVIRNETDGLLVPPRDPDALAGAVVRLLDDEQLRTRLGRAARSGVVENFDFAAVVSSLRLLYSGRGIVVASRNNPETSFAVRTETTN
jgi:glycosyltransferase involved in cell wall biosynthesis/serine acetyltransferase